MRLFLYTLLLLTSRFPSATARLVHILCDSFVAFVFRREDAANPEHTVARIAWAGGEAILFRISAHLLAWAVSNIILCLELADGAWHVGYFDRRSRLAR